MSSSRKLAYSYDFKIKVLEYYFKHGGETTFGLKSKTAQHFGIDKKTISRMLCNPEMVKKASRCLSQRQATSNNNLRVASKPGSKLNQRPISKPNSSSRSSDSATSSNAKSPLAESLNDSRPAEKKISIYDLPEDPDYSLLKRMINSSASGAANVARLLVTATKEVQKMILNECDLIFECKVCKNLFRSVVNFLAHKRIYCPDEYVNVKSVFSENNPLGMTSESSTVVVDPEPPPSTPPPLDEEESESRSKIDQIAERLACRNLRKRKLEEMSSATHTGSSEYFERLQNVHCTRSQVSKSCSIMLKDITSSSTAVYQTFVPPDRDIPDKGIDDFLQEVRQKKSGMTALVNLQGKVVDCQLGEPSEIDIRTLNREEPDIEESSQASSDCISAPSEAGLDTGQALEVERTVYTCPICNSTFLSISGCVQHLYKVHKKKKHQRERLRQVVRSRSYKRVFTQDEIKAHYNRVLEIKSELPSKAPNVKRREREKRPRMAEKKTEGTEVKAKVTESKDTESPVQCREAPNKNLLHCCIKCGRGFLTPGALGSHFKYCQLSPVSPRPVPEMPEKLIAIQIRKDYKKPDSLSSPAHGTTNNLTTSSFQFVKKEPAELSSRENKRKKVDKSLKRGFTSEIDVSPALVNEIRQKLSSICVEKRLYCVPCETRYSKRSVLLKHAALHLEWTRFVCTKCNFRSFHKYLCDYHCVSTHSIATKELEQFVIREDRVGKFKYSLDLISEKANRHSEVTKINSESVNETSSEKEKSALNESSEELIPITRTATKLEPKSNSKPEPANGSLSRRILGLPRISAPQIETSSEIKTLISTEENIEDEERGLNNEEQRSRSERPQRTRRSIEKRDFIYDVKRPPSNGFKGSDNETNDKSSSVSRVDSLELSLKQDLSPAIPDSSDAMCNGSSSPVLEEKADPMRTSLSDSLQAEGSKVEVLQTKEQSSVPSQKINLLGGDSSQASSTSNFPVGNKPNSNL